jgi:hypothetical protein
MQELKALLLSRLASAELGEASPLSAADIADETLREIGAA